MVFNKTYTQNRNPIQNMRYEMGNKFCSMSLQVSFMYTVNVDITNIMIS